MDVSKVCRCQALCLTGWTERAEGRREREQLRNQSAKALISWRYEAKASPNSPRIYGRFARSSRDNCRFVVFYFFSCIFLSSIFFISFFPAFTSTMVFFCAAEIFLCISNTIILREKFNKNMQSL